MQIVDLSHRVTPGMITTPGLPGPELQDHLSFEQSRDHYAAGTEFCIRRVSMVSATGTYLDAPFHRYREGEDVSQILLTRCVGLPAILVAAPNSGEIGPQLLPTDVRGAAVLFYTGWDADWRTPKYGSVDHPFLTEAAAQLLVERGAGLVGIDSVNVDATNTSRRPVHTGLLAAGIPIVENLTNLGAMVTGASFTAAPIAFEGMPSFPVRAYAQF